MGGAGTVAIVIPTLNEEDSIAAVVRALPRDIVARVIVADGGSRDATAERARAAGADVVAPGRGYGRACLAGAWAAGDADILVFMDGDGQHSPADVARLLELLPEYDMVVGARSVSGQASLGRAIGNKIYNWLGSYVTQFPIHDLTSGFRAMKADIAHGFLYLLPNTYSYPTTLTLSVLRTGRSLKYIPIQAGSRKRGTSGIKLFRDGVRFFMIIIRICTLYSPMRVFLPVSVFMVLLGIFNYALTYFTQGRFTNMSALLLTNGVLIFMMSLISEQISQMRFERRQRRVALKKFEEDSRSSE